MRRMHQWDWERLRELCQTLGVDNPSIAIVGNANPFNRYQIKYAWLRHREEVSVESLWRPSDALDWDELDARLVGKDVVLILHTCAHGLRRDLFFLDNKLNASFAERLNRNPRFKGPITLRFGSNEEGRVFVFVRERDEEKAQDPREFEPLAPGPRSIMRYPETSSEQTVEPGPFGAVDGLRRGICTASLMR